MRINDDDDELAIITTTIVINTSGAYVVEGVRGRERNHGNNISDGR